MDQCRQYILNAELVPVPCDDIVAWGKWFEKADRTMASNKTRGGVLVSTVFLGLDHGFTSAGPPVLWETMIFGGPLDEYQLRYCTYADAMAGHACMWFEARHAEVLTRQLGLM